MWPGKPVDLNLTYLLEFILAENGLLDIFSSIGLLTDGIGTLEIPLSYSLRLRSLLLAADGVKFSRSI